MEALLRQRPPPDRNQPKDISPEAVATGKVVKYREKKAKKGDDKSAKGGKEKEVKSGKKAKKVAEESTPPITVQPSQPEAPVLVVPSEVKKKKAPKSTTLASETASSTVMPTPSTSSSKRKRDGKEKSSKSKKKSRHLDVKSRGRLHSRGPSKSHGKRARSLSPSSASESTRTSTSEDSSDESSSDSTDSEEERRRRRRASSKSRGRSRARSRARSRGRSISRARDSSDDSGTNDSDDDSLDEPIFMAFTVPGGKTHMRPIKAGTKFPKLLDTVYALSNISQTIALELSYLMNGMTLQLSDEEDLKALLEAASYTGEMVQVKVERLDAQPVMQPIAATAPVVAAPTVVAAAAPAPDSSTPAKPKKLDRKGKRALEAAKKAEEASQAQQSSVEEASLAPATVNGSMAINGNDSVVSLDGEDDMPLAKIVFKKAVEEPAKKKKRKAEEPVLVADDAATSSAESLDVVKPKRKRRSRAEMEADRLAKAALVEEKAAKKAEVKKQLQELKDGKAAAAAATEVTEEPAPASKAKNSTVVSVDVPSHTPASKAADQSPVKTTELATPTFKALDKSKKTARKSAAEGEAEVEPPSATPKKSTSTSSAKKSSKGQATPAKLPEAAAPKGATSNGAAAAADEEAPAPTPHSGKQSLEQNCDICFESGHTKAYCPIVVAGRKSVVKKLAELKEKKNRKTKPENEAVRHLKGWLEQEKKQREKEKEAALNLEMGTLIYRREPMAGGDGVNFGYASEAERQEDQAEKDEFTNALNESKAKEAEEREKRKRAQAEEQQQQQQSRLSETLSPGKGRNHINGNEDIDDILGKVRNERQRSVKRGSKDPLVVGASPIKFQQSSMEEDQLRSSPSMKYDDNQSRIMPISPTLSESELATSPMLMAGQYQPNGDVQEVTLPSAVGDDSTVTVGEKEKSDGSSDTSDDSSGEPDEREEEEDDIEEEAGGQREQEKSESISNSNSEEEAEKNESEEEVDEIEATPLPSKPSAKSNSIFSTIGSLFGGGSSQEDSVNGTPTPASNQEAAAASAAAMQAPPSGQRVRQSHGTASVASTPTAVNRRGRPSIGATRLSQLEPTLIKSSYSQPNTPRNTEASPAKKRTGFPTHLESDSDSHGESDSDSDHDAKKGAPKNKLAGSQKVKPRKSLLAKFGAA